MRGGSPAARGQPRVPVRSGRFRRRRPGRARFPTQPPGSASPFAEVSLPVLPLLVSRSKPRAVSQATLSGRSAEPESCRRLPAVGRAAFGARPAKLNCCERRAGSAVRSAPAGARAAYPRHRRGDGHAAAGPRPVRGRLPGRAARGLAAGRQGQPRAPEPEPAGRRRGRPPRVPGRRRRHRRDQHLQRQPHLAGRLRHRGARPRHQRRRRARGARGRRRGDGRASRAAALGRRRARARRTRRPRSRATSTIPARGP